MIKDNFWNILIFIAWESPKGFTPKSFPNCQGTNTWSCFGSCLYLGQTTNRIFISKKEVSKSKVFYDNFVPLPVIYRLVEGDASNLQLG